MVLWTTTPNTPAIGIEGALASEPRWVLSRLAEGAVRAGLAVEQGTAEDQFQALAALPAADVDAIILGPVNSAVAVQELAGATLDGAIGAGRIAPARSVTFVANAHANWGLAALGGTWITIVGLDANNGMLSEQMFLPSGGGVTLETEHAFSMVLRVLVGANDGVGGTATVGLSNHQVALGVVSNGIAVYDRAREPSDTVTVTYDDEDSFPVLKEGEAWVIVEAAVVPGDAVGVRTVLNGADVRGQFSKMPSEATATAEFAPLLGARFITAADADELAIVQIGS